MVYRVSYFWQGQTEWSAYHVDSFCKGKSDRQKHQPYWRILIRIKASSLYIEFFTSLKSIYLSRRKTAVTCFLFNNSANPVFLFEHFSIFH